MDQSSLASIGTALEPVIDIRHDPDLAPRHPLTLVSVSAESELGCLYERIAARTSIVAIVGLGYVGLPLLVQASDSGYRVLGIDADAVKIEALRAGESHVVDVPARQFAHLDVEDFSTDSALLAFADVIVVAVPTPLRDGNPDLGMVERAAADIAAALRPGQLVILESTTYPGTTQELFVPILERSGLRVGVDIAVGYSPERIDPGSGRETRSVPKIVSGVDATSAELVESFYANLGFETHRAPSPSEAEMAKLIENTFRQVNIALVNELAVVAADLNVDIWAALEAAASKTFGYMPFWPGPGVGGHCIAIDPSYLSWKAVQRRGYGLGFIDHALSVNNAMPRYVARRVAEALNDHGKALNGSRILALGVAYKPRVNDTRESPAFSVVEALMAGGAQVAYSDPYVADLAIGEVHLISQDLGAEHLTKYDCVVLLTAHPEFDLAEVVRWAPLVFDAQGATRHERADNVVLL